MNERIKELADQAELTVRTGRGNTYMSHPEFNKKFAELIVQECIEVCKSRVGNSDYNTGRMHCASDLKEHFGVKE